MKDLTRDLLTFLDESTCNFLAVKNIRRRLDACGFQSLDLRDHWDLKAGGNYYTTINDSALFAFRVGEGEAHEGFRIVCSHTDSPGFRLKPNCEITSDGNMLTLNTEVYGGPILYTWFDRPLSISGRVVLRSEDPFRHEVRMVKFSRPLLTIPHLAIHYNRSVNEGNPLSKQRDTLPLMAILDDQHETKGCITRMVADELGISEAQIADYDLTLYATEPACTFGMHDEFISASRIDDLEMAHCALTALCNAVEGKKVDEDYAGEATPAARKVMRQSCVAAFFDNEETGSNTKQGAASPTLKRVLQRICTALGGNEEDFSRAVAASFMISADNGHATHPNYISKQDPTNHPVLGSGPVIKINANCKYMTDADSAAVFADICQRANVPVQMFVNHSDVAGGSTLGNILTSQLDMRGVDMGAPQLAMHSCRETAAVADHIYICKAFTEFYTC